MKFILNDGKEEHSFEIQPGATIIGRSGSCDVNLHSQRVSRRHVECHREGDEVRVRDLGSANGTYVNGIRITQPVILNDGDKVAIGDISLLFSTGTNDQPAAAAAAAAAGPSAFAAPPRQDEAQSGEYSEDEPTPPDGTFMPEIVRAEGPPQPMLTQRDGRWFVRDPITNREVEIVPKGQPAPAAEEKNKKLITYGVIGGAVLLAVILISQALPKNGSSTGPNSQHIYSKSQYNNMVDKAISLFENGKANEAVAKLKKADADRPEYKIAGILQDVFEEYAEAGENMAGFDSDKVWALLNSAERQSKTAAADAQVNILLDKVEKLQRERDLFIRGQQLVQDGKLTEAYEVLRKLTVDSPVRAQNKDYIRKLLDDCRLTFVDKGNRAMQQGEWDTALQHYKTAADYAPTTNHRDEIDEKIDKCIRGNNDKKILETALDRFEDKDYSGAIEALRDIDEQSHYASATKDLIKKALAAKDRDHVEALYAGGNARAAIDYIKQNNMQNMFVLRDKAEAVLDAFNKAKKFDNTIGHITDARDAYRKVVELESDKDNYYYRQADKRLEDIEKDKEGLAQEYLRKAYAALDRGDIKNARALAQRAWDTDNRKEATVPDPDDPKKQVTNFKRAGARLLQRLDNKARKFYIDGMARKARKDIEGARKLFKKAIVYAEEGGNYHKRALDALDALDPPE